MALMPPPIPIVKYTKRPDDTGWLAVLLSASGQLAYLCEFTRVETIREAGGRLFFKIADGNSGYVGEEASLKRENAGKFLTNGPPSGPATVQVSYSGSPADEVSPFKGSLKQQWARLHFGGNHAVVTLNSEWLEHTPIPAGTHIILAPDQSHANTSTAGYRGATVGLRCTDVWFPIQLAGNAGDSGRYIHVGHLSHGCVTVHELTKWNAVYDYLIARRVPGSDGKFIGSLIVRQ